MEEDRITDLEIRFSHQQDFIQKLNDVIVSQQTSIERMEKEILDLKRSVNSEAGVPGKRNLEDDRPPHF
ncbi:MAG TPA: SlyX family protein [Bacteriovoracaceae bacterium]|nr:SlyX family protein [Bacteriovoracaceae bacterium]